MRRASIAEEAQTRTYFDGSTKTFVDTGVWQTSGKPGDYDECRIEGTFMTIYDEGGHSPEQARHIVRWNPARVLVECEAKRRRLEALDDLEGEAEESEWRWIARHADGLRALEALPYADRPGYLEEWRP